ncbi:hypothetical protein [Aquimonas voraii]|uniref:TonB C-terminal domain-containing protein n=1 Tax=Aquimonas voraii TaxID=265719 RepID=A0A1G6XY66_9GAMM|nr:hypothetical protein [Aquimonas voraii]SDD82387.1 hypothetical protein SAMN04488509_1083 [Aquimonas voraii]
MLLRASQLILLFALCLVATFARAQADEALAVNAILDLAADGSVEKVEIHDAGLLLPYVREGVANSVRRMRFEPVVIDGQARRVRTSALFRIGFEGWGEARKLLVTTVMLGQPIATAAPFLPFPEAPMQRGHGALLWLLVEVDAQGKVLGSEPLAVVLSALPRASGDDRERQASIQDYLQRAQDSVRGWTILMAEANAEGRQYAVVTFDYALQEEGGAAREFPASTFPALERSGIRVENLRERSRSLPPGTLMQISMLR